MTFSFINAAGAAIVALMLLPNILYALRHPGQKNKCRNRWMNVSEQAGRYGSILLMVLPLGVKEFGFPSVEEMLLYLFGNGALLLGYWVYWYLYARRPGKSRALTLAVLPTAIFLLSGVILRHWLLVAAAAVFGVGHVYVTLENH